MSNNAVGLEQVGGVTQAAKGMVENADGRVQAAKVLQSMSESTHRGMVGPAGDTMRNVMDTHSGASGMAAKNGAEVGANFATGEKTVVQGTVDSLQQQKTSATDAESTFSQLSRPMEA